MAIYLQFLISFSATIGFSIVFNVQRRLLLTAGSCGALGWITYVWLLDKGASSVSAGLIAAILIGLLGELFARIQKSPVISFVIPGIIPIVPGYGIYRTMTAMLQNDFERGAMLGANTLLNAGAIAMGIIVVSSLARIFKHIKDLPKKYKRPLR